MDAVPESEYIVLCPVPDSSPATKTIETPEESIAITPPLHNATSALRRMSDSFIMLWSVDISIDPENKEERLMMNRIRDMKMIYANAKQVVVFLGAEDDDTGDALDLFNKLARADISAWPTGLEDLECVGLPPITDSSWVTLDRFLCRRWFRSIQALPACI